VRLVQNVVAAALLLGLLTSCGKRLSQTECLTMLERYTGLLASSDRKELSSLERLKLEHQAREKALHDREFARCPSEVSRREFDCAMHALTVDEFERCLL